jgi:hypothetical protein
LRLDPCTAEDLDEVLREQELVTWRIRRVDADQRAQMLDRLTASLIPVGLVGRGQRAVGEG